MTDWIEIILNTVTTVIIIAIIVVGILLYGKCTDALDTIVKNLPTKKYECINGNLYEHIKDHKGIIIKKSLNVKCKKK